MTSLSRPVPSAPRTLTGMIETPSYPTPAMPMPLSVAAATMPAIAVPWPFGSVSRMPPTSDVPPTSLPARSGCEASTPVSRTATVAEPATAEP